MSTLKNLSDQKAIDKLKEIAEAVGICLFATELTQLPIHSRPMGLSEVDASGNLWFISSRSSNKNFEIEKDNRVQLFFSKAADNHFLSVYGTAEIYTDPQKIEALWQPLAKAFFEEGKNDPEVTAICVKPEEAYYWESKNGKLVSLLKIGVAALTGIYSDGSREGNIHV
ncbi:pyridoxamine 5'-phosphate oxidase family protein [Flavobacterium sp.]|uniref:pyridoxamine 5'-phosphate oxidase family protein n=1 Tax=Flavobacterium sp. TaxID=239 RepID=UPI0039E3F1AE